MGIEQITPEQFERLIAALNALVDAIKLTGFWLCFWLAMRALTGK